MRALISVVGRPPGRYIGVPEKVERALTVLQVLRNDSIVVMSGDRVVDSAAGTWSLHILYAAPHHPAEVDIAVDAREQYIPPSEGTPGRVVYDWVLHNSNKEETS